MTQYPILDHSLYEKSRMRRKKRCQNRICKLVDLTGVTSASSSLPVQQEWVGTSGPITVQTGRSIERTQLLSNEPLASSVTATSGLDCPAHTNFVPSV